MRCAVVLRPGGVVANLLDWRLTLLQHLLNGSGCGDALAPLMVRTGLVGNAAPCFTVPANEQVALPHAIVT